MDVWGKFALFTRPECKVERYSYEVPTPSSLRNLLQSIYWHPTFDYEVTGIQVYNRVRHRTITRNELSSVMRSGNALKTMESVLETGEGPSLSVPASMPSGAERWFVFRFVACIIYISFFRLISALIIKGIPRSMGAKICVVGQKVVSFIIIQKFHLTSRLFIRTVCGSPVILWVRKSKGRGLPSSERKAL